MSTIDYLFNAFKMSQKMSHSTKCLIKMSRSKYLKNVSFTMTQKMSHPKCLTFLGLL